MEDKKGDWSAIALTALPAAMWGSTYAVTQAWLPPGRPLFAATVRALPVGLLMLLWVRRLPRGSWWWRSAVLGSLTIGFFYALLFLAAYRLPSGLGATLVATAPMVTMALSWLVLRQRPARAAMVASAIGLLGVALLVLENGLSRPVDALGLAGGFGAVVLASTGFVLTKRWSPAVDVLTVTTWQLVAGGLVLLPIGLVVEGAPPALDLPAVAALAYLGLLGSGLAYVLWFRGLALLGPTPTSIIGLVNPVVGVLLGVALLDESFGPMHLVAMLLILASVLGAQDPVRAWFLQRTRMQQDAGKTERTRPCRPSTSPSSAWAPGASTSRGPLPGPASTCSASSAAS